MTDDLEQLGQALRRQTPAPSEGAKERALAAAMENFHAQSQGSPDQARPTNDRPHGVARILEGLKMFGNRLTSRTAMLGTASLATLAMAVVVVQDYQPPRFATPEAPVTTINEGLASVEEDKSDANLDGVLALEAAPSPPPARADQLSEIGNLQNESFNDGRSPATAAPKKAAVGAQTATEEVVTEEEASEIAATPEAQRRQRDLATMRESIVQSFRESRGLVTTPDDARSGGAASDQDLAAGGVPVETEEETFAEIPPVAAEPVLRAETVSRLFPEPANPAPAEEAATLGAVTKSAIGNAAPVLRQEVEVFVAPQPEANTERFPEVAPSDLKQVKTDPVSTFSIDVDTASYSFVRSSLMAGQKPNPDSVRIEEMINYFDYDYPMPEGREVPFQTSVAVSDTPWNEGTKLIQIGIQGYDLPVAERPNANLVFLIDTSGSMSDANKLPLLIQSFRLLLSSLSENDTVAIVTYAGSAGMVLEPTPASETAKILNSLNNLHAGGSTAGHAGLQQAYALAEQMAEDGDMSRVILATDGDFNVGISDTDQLQEYIEEKRDTGVYLSILGFGRGNTNDQLMQALAQNGNGTAAYIDTLAEAQKVLVDEASGALFSIAGDVKIQMEFNPAQIAEYRLIGYETRALKREDFNNDAVDAGEIGAGHTVTAIYEVTPVGSPARRIDDLRYSTTDDVEAIPASGNPEYGFLKLRYKLPGESRSKLIETPIMPDRADIDVNEVRFATAVAGFGEYLKGSDYLGDWGPEQIDALASTVRGDDPFGYRAEFLRLVRLSRTAQ